MPNSSSPTPAPASDRHPLRLMAVLCALMGFASISTDFYLPAMPAMGHALHASAGEMERTVAGYLVGFSLGQLFWGPVGDRFGRKRPIGIGLVLFIIGSAGCALSGSANEVIAWRVVQSSGACASVVLSRAMVRDLYGPERAGQMMSTLITVMAIAPLIGPLLGGEILALAGWRAIFWTLVAVGVITGIGLATVPETLPPERRGTASLVQAFGDYRLLVRDRVVMGCALIGGAYYFGVYAYIAGSPFVFITYSGLSPSAYGMLFGLGIVSIMAANMLNVRLLPRYGSAPLIKAGALVSGLSGVALGLAARTGWGGLAALAVPCFIFCGASGLMVANTMARAMNHRPQQAGAVSALLGAAQYGFGMLGSFSVSLLANGTPMPMGGIIAASGVAAVLAAYAMPRAHSRPYQG